MSKGTKKVALNRVGRKITAGRPSTPKGYVYLGQTCDAKPINSTGDCKVTIKLLDVKTNEKISRRGTVRTINGYTVTTIDSLEGHANVYFRLHFIGDKGIVEYTNNVGWTVSPE
jgi:hypothetical protein